MDKFKVWINHKGSPAETRLIEAISYEKAAEKWAQLHDESRSTRLDIASHRAFPVVHVQMENGGHIEQWMVTGEVEATYWASEPEDPPP